jgi:hypothetical protein
VVSPEQSYCWKFVWPCEQKRRAKTVFYSMIIAQWAWQVEYTM